MASEPCSSGIFLAGAVLAAALYRSGISDEIKSGAMPAAPDRRQREPHPPQMWWALP
ncbi:hypothetical protein [Rhodococcoides kyotonense]|uniref:hypothetical protein n=1 Tax=Rhodococcoides kyotonense TaxID=398843 RepID=UPI00159596CE|nr:hypothetical protein [Rhodococcus kyotonensis]